jgi:GH25 family lysozyme M1 (1,4-beta-N-acetylmuramidase)
MSTIVGNDVANFQGQINWDVYKNNANFCILKATEGVGYIDSTFKRNQQEGRRVGLPLGFYHFARPDLGNSAEAEANYFIQQIGTLNDGDVLCLDYEPASQNQEHVNWCKTWLDKVFAVTGVRALIYLNQSQVKKFNWKVVVDGGYGLWIAAYTETPLNNNYEKGLWQFAAMQQWTSSQIVTGIPSKAVDGNVFFGDVNTFKKYGYKRPLPPTDYKKLYDEIVPKYNDATATLGKAISDMGRLNSEIVKLTANNKILASEVERLNEKIKNAQKDLA